jgi:hypothetical protein
VKRITFVLVVLAIMVLAARHMSFHTGHSKSDVTKIRLLTLKKALELNTEFKELIVTVATRGVAVRLDRLNNNQNKSNEHLQEWIESFDLSDGWGNPIWCKTVNGNNSIRVIIWSCGANGINEDGASDDIIVEASLNEK